jgi:hypothetical protein
VCITTEELVEWLELVESAIPKAEISKATALPQPSDPPSSSRTMLALVATVAGSITLAWFAFLVWLALKASRL